jgi:hypothetical protein
MEKLVKYVKETFDVDIETFLEILQTNPNARQNINGIMGEMLFKEYAESKGYEVLRIKEKPSGGYNAKSADARGDFYIRKKDSIKDEWFVVECKGVKSNAEKRANLTNTKSCLNILNKHSVERKKHVESIYKSGQRAYLRKKESWESDTNKTFPRFSWNENNPGSGIPDLTGLWDSKKEIKEWLETFSDESFTENAYWDLTAPVRLLQTHMPSSRLDPETKIKKTGPLVSEFNILSVDLFLKTGKHEFAFVNSADLNHQAESPNHLQQNYTIDILTAKDGFKRHNFIAPWFDDMEKCINETKPKPRKLDKSQLDLR